MHGLVSDLVYSFRMIRKSPLFSLGVVLTLAVGLAHAEYFFLVAGDRFFDECMKTAADGPENVEAMMERHPSVDCDLDTSNPGFSVITCTSRPPSTTYVTDTEEACEALRVKVTGSPKE